MSSFERPDREVALDGPVTATRAQLVWQVKVLLPEGGRTPHDYAAATNLSCARQRHDAGPRGRLPRP